MGKYLTIVLAMMIVTMAIAFLSPFDGGVRDEPFYELFWISVGGAVVVIIYSSYKNQKSPTTIKTSKDVKNIKNNFIILDQMFLQDLRIACRILNIVSLLEL